MTKVMRGVFHGKIIELTEDLGMLDGQALDIIVTPSTHVEPPSGATFRKHRQKSFRGRHPDMRPELAVGDFRAFPETTVDGDGRGQFTILQIR